MLKKTNVEINQAVLQGLIPVAFFNSQIIPSQELEKRISIKTPLNKKYMQKSLPDSNSQFPISKIYELF